jgi:hypothetical protein
MTEKEAVEFGGSRVKEDMPKIYQQLRNEILEEAAISCEQYDSLRWDGAGEIIRGLKIK